ncbi:MAG: hypothetical protein R6U96_13155, partial [Promethearchaeia archaeon]
MLRFKRLVPKAALFSIILIILVPVFSGSSNFIYQANVEGYDRTKHDPFSGRKLNDSISLTIPEDTYSDQVHVNFTQLNESRDFVRNGGMDGDDRGWNSTDETDVNYSWTEDGPEDSNCLSINTTGKNSNHT